ncbi:MAG: methyltransferase family protein [Woeseiaceae bacterium]
MTTQDRVLKFRPPRIAVGLAATALLVNAIYPIALHSTLPVAGAITAVAGFAIMLRAWWLFQRADTPIRPTDDSTTLITDDIYALSRNPMYLGITLMLLAAGLATGSFPFFVATLANFAIIDRHFCAFEEKRLLVQYGDEYRDYCARVRRWI